MIKVTKIGFVWQVLNANELAVLPFHKLELYRVYPDESCARILTTNDLNDALARHTHGEVVAIPLGSINEALERLKMGPILQRK